MACDLNGNGVITTQDVMVLVEINRLLARDRRIRRLLPSPSVRPGIRR